jgi:hypothetical protein
VGAAGAEFGAQIVKAPENLNVKIPNLTEIMMAGGGELP